MFEEAESSTSQNVERKVKAMMEQGIVAANLMQMLRQQSGYSITYSVGDGHPETFTESEVAEARRQAIFFSSEATLTGQLAAQNFASDFSEAIDRLDKLMALLLQLEASGHPNFQAQVIRLPLARLLRNFDEMEAEHAQV